MENGPGHRTAQNASGTNLCDAADAAVRLKVVRLVAMQDGRSFEDIASARATEIEKSNARRWKPAEGQSPPDGAADDPRATVSGADEAQRNPLQQGARPRSIGEALAPPTTLLDMAGPHGDAVRLGQKRQSEGPPKREPDRWRDPAGHTQTKNRGNRKR